MNTFPVLAPSETLLEGKWVFSGNSVGADDTSRRIDFLISTALIKVATDNSGWFVLYKDPQDSRYWELSYPDGEQHGGGAPTLRQIAADEANGKYVVI